MATSHHLLLAVATCIVLVANSVVIALPVNFQRGYPISLRNDSDVPTQYWILDPITLVIRMATDNNSCLETYMGDGEGNMVTLWNCLQRLRIFFYKWVPSQHDAAHGQVQQNGTLFCLGFDRDVEGAMVRTLNCTNTSHTTWKRSDNTSKFTIPGTAFSTPGGLRLGVPMPYTEYHELRSDDVIIGISIAGFAPRNITHIAKLLLWQPLFGKWSTNLMQWPWTRTQDFSFFSTSSITEQLANGMSRWKHAANGAVTAKTNGSITIEGITIGDISTETWEISTEALPDGKSTTLKWKISRRYLRDVVEINSRYATFVLTNTQATVWYLGTTQQAQIISSLDHTFQRNLTSASAF